MRPLVPRHLPQALAYVLRPLLRLHARLGYDRYMPGMKAAFKKYANASGKGSSSDAPAAVTILDFFDFLDVSYLQRRVNMQHTARNAA